MSAACLSFANKKARLSVLVRGARLCHALLKALDSPLNYLARRHPKLKGYRLASHVSAFRRSKFSRDKVCKSLADPVGPPGGGTRRRAMLLRLSKRSEISISNRRPGGGKEHEKVFGQGATGRNSLWGGARRGGMLPTAFAEASTSAKAAVDKSAVRMWKCCQCQCCQFPVQGWRRVRRSRPTISAATSAATPA